MGNSKIASYIRLNCCANSFWKLLLRTKRARLGLKLFKSRTVMIKAITLQIKLINRRGQNLLVETMLLTNPFSVMFRGVNTNMKER